MGKRQKRSQQGPKQRQDELNSSAFSQLSALGDVEAVEPEDVPRRFAGGEEEEEGLPIIVDGRVQRVKRKLAATSSDSESEKSESEAEEKPEEPEPEFVEISGTELKELVALYADLLGAEPESNLGRLRELVEIAEKTRKTKNRQILLLSLLQIFKSIVPGYRIAELSEAQMKERVSKDVKQLRDFEQGLLAAYKRFVRLLHHSFRQSKEGNEAGDNKSRQKYILGSTALEVACDLVESLAHFNCRQQLILIVVEKLGSQRIDQAFTRCINCLGTVFELDEEGHVSFEAVQAVSRMVKARRYKVDSRVLGVLVKLRLLTELRGRADLERLIKEKPQSMGSQLGLKKKDRVHLTKNQRKARREQQEIDEEMRKAELGVSSQVRERLQAQTLKLVFVIYMNVLKIRARNLLGVTLEGLARFAHLINADLYGDLLEVLRELLETDGSDNTRQSLLCILTAFQLLHGQGASHAQSTDLGFFVDALYATLLEMGINPQIERSHRSLQSSHAGKFASETDLLVRCLELLFIKRRGVSQPRLLAFTKRLAECSLQFPERSCLVVLKTMREIVRQHPQAAALLTTHDRVARGTYNAFASVPEQANAEVATVWEVALLRQHFDPRVKEAAREVH